jgi:hypothetical protein
MADNRGMPHKERCRRPPGSARFHEPALRFTYAKPRRDAGVRFVEEITETVAFAAAQPPQWLGDRHRWSWSGGES